jgi:hypothetical protein
MACSPNWLAIRPKTLHHGGNEDAETDFTQIAETAEG